MRWAKFCKNYWNLRDYQIETRIQSSPKLHNIMEACKQFACTNRIGYKLTLHAIIQTHPPPHAVTMAQLSSILLLALISCAIVSSVFAGTFIGPSQCRHPEDSDRSCNQDGDCCSGAVCRAGETNFAGECTLQCCYGGGNVPGQRASVISLVLMNMS